MHHSIRLASVLWCALLLLLAVSPTLAAQVSSAADQTADVLGRMRADLTARRYDAVIADANGLLESARAISTAERIELWQLLAAAYYPNARNAQKPDSARLPLAALIRLAPDFKIAREFSWSGLDELTERTRAGSFAVATRPLSEYTLGAPNGAVGHIAAVASRRTRFRLSSVDDATGRTVVHDSSGFVRVAALQLRTHDAQGPIFTDGLHQLHVWAFDLESGDSVRIAHRVRALRNDLPPPTVAADADAAAAEAVVTPLAAAPRSRPKTIGASQRSSILLGGLALALATAVIAQDARPDDALGAAFRVDARAFVTGAVMAGAAVANFFVSRATTRPAEQSLVTTTLPPTSPPTPAADIYRVRLQIDPPER